MPPAEVALTAAPLVPLFRAPWEDPAFVPIATALVVAAVIAAVGLAIVTHAGRGGAPPATLWARWATWVVLAGLFTTCVFTGPLGTAALMLLFALQGLREWTTLLDLPSRHRLALAGYACVAIGLSLVGPEALLAAIPLLLLGGMLQPVLGADVQRGMRDLAYGALGFAYLPLLLAFGVLLVGERAGGPVLLFATGAAAAASDIGAYIAGKTLGRHKLAPTLSPNKTVEGLLGNLAGAALAVALLAGFLPLMPAGLALMAVVVAAAAVWGDLF